MAPLISEILQGEVWFVQLSTVIQVIHAREKLVKKTTSLVCVFFFLKFNYYFSCSAVLELFIDFIPYLIYLKNNVK